MIAPTVEIRYRRLPERLDVYTQAVLDRNAEYTVTFLESADIPRAASVGTSVVLEPGSPVIWFTYPGEWFDIGRFHRADGTFTGIYANILTPVEMDPTGWDTTDLFLDVWRGVDGRVELLDEDEFREAIERGWLDPPTAQSAWETAARLAESARAGTWPPAHVDAWSLERARATLDELRRARDE